MKNSFIYYNDICYQTNGGFAPRAVVNLHDLHASASIFDGNGELVITKTSLLTGIPHLFSPRFDEIPVLRALLKSLSKKTWTIIPGIPKASILVTRAEKDSSAINYIIPYNRALNCIVTPGI